MSEIWVTCTSHTKQDRWGEQSTHTAEADYLPSQFTGGQQKNQTNKQQTTKRNTVELQMVSERKVAVPLLLSLYPKQEGWKRHKTCLQLQGGHWLRCSWAPKGMNLQSTRPLTTCLSAGGAYPASAVLVCGNGLGRAGYGQRGSFTAPWGHYYCILWRRVSVLIRTTRDKFWENPSQEVFLAARSPHLTLCLNLNTWKPVEKTSVLRPSDW